MVWTTTLALIATPFSGPQLSIPVYLLGFTPFFAILWASLVLLRKGRSRGAAWLMALGTLVLQGLVNFFNQGMEAQARIGSMSLSFKLKPLSTRHPHSDLSLAAGSSTW